MNTLNSAASMPDVVFTNGVFDVFHEGHAKFLERASAEGSQLLVGVASDESCEQYKRRPLQDWEIRAARLRANPHVTCVIKTPWSIDLEPGFYEYYKIDLHVQGDRGSNFQLAEDLGIFKELGRTDGISTTELLGILSSNEKERLAKGWSLSDLHSQNPLVDRKL